MATLAKWLALWPVRMAILVVGAAAFVVVGIASPKRWDAVVNAIKAIFSAEGE